MSIIESARRASEKKKNKGNVKSPNTKNTTQKSKTTSQSTQKTSSIIESAYKAAGRERQSGAKYSSAPSSSKNKQNNTSTKKPTDYSSAVKYLQNKCVQGASGMMTENEWRRRNRNSGTYQNYLDSMISKYSKGNTDLTTKTNTHTTNKNVQDNTDDTWFKKGAFDDGYDFGDATKTVLGTAGDFLLNAVKGVGGMAEGLVDLGTYGVAGVADLVGADEFAKKTKDVARYKAVEEWMKEPIELFDDYSVLGNKGDGIAQGVGQVLGIVGTAGLGAAAGLGSVGVTALTTGATGLSSMGTNMGEAYDNNATDGEAFVYGLGTGAIEAGTELLFGGLGKGVKALGVSRGIGGLDDIFAKKLSSKIAGAVANESVQRAIGNTLEFGVKSGGEGFEEVLAGTGSAVMKKLTYMSDEDIGKLIEDEQLLDQFIVGTIVSGIVQSPSYISANRTGVDFVTGQTSNQERAIDTLAEHKIAEREAIGAKLTAREKNKIYADVRNEVNRAIENTPDTLEQAARDVVAERNRTSSAAYERLEGMSLNNEPIKVEDVKKVTGFGEEGSKMVAELANQDGKTFSQAVREVKTAYLAGSANVDGAKVNFVNDTQIDAFTAGKKDRAMQDLAAEARAKKATVYKGTFTENEYTKNYTDAEKTMISTVAKSLRMDIATVDKIIASEVDDIKYEANAEHQDGRMRISNNRDASKVVYKMVMHEGGHRMRQIAPTEFGALMDALYERAERLGRATKLGVSQGLLFDDIKGKHDAAAIEMDTSEYIEEIAVRELETLFASPEEFNSWYAEISGNQQAKTGLQKLMDFISELVEDIKTAFAELSGKKRVESENTVKELERIKELYANAYKAAEKAATERTKAQGKEAQKNFNTSGNVESKTNFALREDAEAEVTKVLNGTNSQSEIKLTDSSPAIMLGHKGVRNLPMTMIASHIRENIFTEAEAKAKGLKVNKNINYHGLGKELFLKVIAGLDDVTEAYRGTLKAEDSNRRENYFLLISQYTDVEGNIINVPVFINEKGLYNRAFIDTNKIATVFGRDELRGYINKQIRAGNLVRIKKRSSQTSESASPINAHYGNGTSVAGQSVTSDASTTGNIISQTPKFVKSDFSIKDTDSLSAKDRNELLDVIEHLKGEFEITKFAKADPKKLAKMTREVLKEYSSQADFDETYKAIDELYKYMANGADGHTAVWEDVYNRAYNIAREIVRNAVAVDDYLYKEYKSLRDYLRNTPMKFYAEHNSVPSSYENFNEFRKMNMGRLKFTKDGVAIDAVYQELAGLYPEFFDETEQNNTADQLERIIDVLDELQPTEVNPFDRQIEQASAYLASDLASRFFDIPQAKPTFADKAERRVTEAHIKGAKKVEAVRQQKDEKIQKLLEAQREKTKKQIDKLREQRDTKVKKEQEKRRAAISKMSESQKAKVYRARIMRHASDLSKKLVNPTDNQHIPYELQGAVATLLEHINLESNYTYDTESHSYKKNDEGLPTSRTKAFEELRGVYKNIASSVVVDPDLLGEDGLLSDVIKLADKRIADMTSSELETVWQTMRAIEASVNTANKLFSQGKFATILEVAEALRTDNKGKKASNELKLVGGLKRTATLNMLTPETYLHYLGKAGDSVFRMMRDAQDKHIRIMKEVTDFTHKTLKDVDVNSLETTVHTVKLGGENVQLSTAHLMELYVLMKREQAVDHILIGGILPDKVKTKGIKDITRVEPVRNVTVAEISKATAKLTDKQKAIADKLQRYVSSVLSAYGNEASMQVYNYEKFNEKNYWTIRTNKQEIASDVSKDTAVSTVAGKGMAKGTKPHANTSVRIGSIFDTFSAHSSDMATYAAWLGTTEDVNRIRNFVFWDDGVRTGTVKGILDTVHGTEGAEYFEELLTDISIGVQGTDNLNPFDKLTGHFKAASIGANVRVVIQQPTAILRALDMIDARYFAESGVHPLKGWEKAKKYAPIAQWKDWGYFDINTGRQMKDILFDNANLLEKTKQAGMWGASKADSSSWGQLWNAVEAETKAKHNELEVGSELYYETVAKRFTEIVDHTQVVDGILQRSRLMRSSRDLVKMATSFMGEPTKIYNMAVAAAYDAKKSKGAARKKAMTRLGRTAAALAVSGIINACAQSIIDAMRDDDKEKDYWEKWLAAFIGDGEETKFINSNLANVFNPLGYVPFVKDALSILQGYDVKRMDMEIITKAVNAIGNMSKAVTGTGKYTIAEASAQLFAEIARMFGVPVANVKRDIKSLVMSVAIETDSYLMQYRIEKAMLDINYASNSKNFMDILFNAYNNDREAYEFIYNDMLKNGYEADKIQSGMETRMKKAEGVEKSSELSKRYMTPETEKKYDSSLSKVKSSKIWKSANATQRKEAEVDLYNFLTSDSKTMEETRAEARAAGVDETEYTLWQLAIETADQPKGQKGSGSYDYTEKAEAINSLNLGDEEIAYFFGKGLNETAKEELNEVLNDGIDVREYVNFKAVTSEMKADKNAKGNSIPNSKKKKVVNYLNNANLTREEWEYFYYEIMNYKK
ncbi:MAG: hypothetical protein IJ300_01500 [Clostridia bacterium]|nr:hypothetical protein [Clostridia bacterium]